jgi:hypothetical protein
MHSLSANSVSLPQFFQMAVILRSLNTSLYPPSPLVRACEHSTPARFASLFEPSQIVLPDSSCSLCPSVEVDVGYKAFFSVRYLQTVNNHLDELKNLIKPNQSNY